MDAAHAAHQAASAGGQGGDTSDNVQSEVEAGRELADSLIPEEAQGAIWDLDGTLLASNDSRADSWRRACEVHGLHIDKDKYMAETGKSGRDIVDLLCAEQGVDLPPEARQDLVKKEGEIFKSEGLDKSRPIPVVLAIAGQAAARGLRMAVASGGQGDVVQQAMESYGLRDVFSEVITSSDVPHAKPHPDIFLKAADALGVPIERCVVFEDAPMGFEAAQRAGALKVVDVTTLPGHPDRTDRHG